MPKLKRKLPSGFKLGGNVFRGTPEGHLKKDLKNNPKLYGKIKRTVIKK
jgi:hypothetical protein